MNGLNGQTNNVSGLPHGIMYDYRDGFSFWDGLLLIVILVGLFLVTRIIWVKLKSRRKNPSALELLEQRITDIKVGSSLSDASVLVKLFIGEIFKADFQSRSSDELGKLLKAYSVSSELRLELCTFFGGIEKRLYMSGSAQNGSVLSDDLALISRLRESLSAQIDKRGGYA